MKITSSIRCDIISIRSKLAGIEDRIIELDKQEEKQKKLIEEKYKKLIDAQMEPERGMMYSIHCGTGSLHGPYVFLELRHESYQNTNTKEKYWWGMHKLGSWECIALEAKVTGITTQRR